MIITVDFYENNSTFLKIESTVGQTGFFYNPMHQNRVKMCWLNFGRFFYNLTTPLPIEMYFGFINLRTCSAHALTGFENYFGYIGSIGSVFSVEYPSDKVLEGNLDNRAQGNGPNQLLFFQLKTNERKNEKNVKKSR